MAGSMRHYLVIFVQCTLYKIMIDFLDTKMALKYLSLNFYKQNPKSSDVLSNSIMQFYILSGKLDF